MFCIFSHCFLIISFQQRQCTFSSWPRFSGSTFRCSTFTGHSGKPLVTGILLLTICQFNCILLVAMRGIHCKWRRYSNCMQRWCDRCHMDGFEHTYFHFIEHDKMGRGQWKSKEIAKEEKIEQKKRKIQAASRKCNIFSMDTIESQTKGERATKRMNQSCEECNRQLCENLNNCLAKHVNYVWFNRWTYLNQIQAMIMIWLRPVIVSEEKTKIMANGKLGERKQATFVRSRHKTHGSFRL